MSLVRQNNLFRSLNSYLATTDRSSAVTSVSKRLCVATGTVKRWIELQRVPESYTFDIMDLCGLPIDYTSFSFSDKDQFFTPPDTAAHCLKRIAEHIDTLSVATWVEPSAGDGVFVRALHATATATCIAMDIEPRSEGILKQEFLSWRPPPEEVVTGPVVVFGNPPFGNRGNLALRFINHSFTFADHVAFILPPLFDSDGKGVPCTRVQGGRLIHSETLRTQFVYPDDKKIKINCIFQIWTRHDTTSSPLIHNNKNKNKNNSNDSFHIYSLSDGGTPSSTRNKSKLHSCDVYVPSTCFGTLGMRTYRSFDELPNRRGYGVQFNNPQTAPIEWLLADDNQHIWLSGDNAAFQSTNSAYNLRASMIRKQILAVMTQTRL